MPVLFCDVAALSARKGKCMANATMKSSTAHLLERLFKNVKMGSDSIMSFTYIS